MSHLFVHYFKSKVERKCLLKYLISLGHTPPIPVSRNVKHEFDSSFTEHVIQEISGTCADTKRRGIKATCIVSSDRAQPQISSYWKQQKTWQWPADKAMVILCVNILQTQSAMELNQKLTESMPRRHSPRDIYKGDITYVRHWRGGYCLKRAFFQELTVP